MSTGTQAIDRAAELLSRVVLADEKPGFGELVTDTGLAKSTASRLLQALERHRLVHRDDAGGYAAGALFALYASRHEPLDELITLAQPTMQELSDATGETVNLAVPRTNTVVQVAQIDATFLLGTVNWVDVDVPPHCSALGKVFYAAGAIELPTDGPRAPYRPHHHRPRRPRPAARARSGPRGTPSRSASSRSASTRSRHPSPARGGEVIAALGISGPSDRINHRLDALGELLTHHAAELSRALGAPAPTATQRKEGAA